MLASVSGLRTVPFSFVPPPRRVATYRAMSLVVE